MPLGKPSAAGLTTEPGWPAPATLMAAEPLQVAASRDSTATLGGSRPVPTQSNLWTKLPGVVVALPD
jgi:hypothetical protein